MLTGSVPSQPLHPHGAPAQGPPLHLHPAPPARHALWVRVRALAVPQDGLSRPPLRHASHTVRLCLRCLLFFFGVLLNCGNFRNTIERR